VPAAVSVFVLTACPTNAFEPLQDPDAVQVLALTVDQVSAAALPATICVGSTLMLTLTGGGCVEVLTTTQTVLAELPPGPAHVSV
jgi:hypothetical protein